MKTKLFFVFLCIAMFCNKSKAQVWGNQPIPDFTSVHFVDSLIGWAGGIGNPIFKTSDGGKTWSPQIGKIKSINKLNYNSIKFIDINNGFICGQNTGDSSKQAFILKTTDGGTNWDTNLVLANSSFDYEFSAFSYINSQIAFAVGDKKSNLKAYSDSLYKPLLYKTTNGGKNWINLTINLGISNCYFSDMKFVDANKGWIAGQNDSLNSRIILKTTDGGLTWARQVDEKKSFGYGFIRQISLIDSLNLFATATDNRDRELLMNTTDGGVNWIGNYDIPFNLAGYQGLYFTDKLNGILCGTVIAGGSLDNYQIIIKTTDGGVTWDSVYAIKNQLTNVDNIANYYITRTFDLYEASFVNSNRGFLVGVHGNVLTTSNGGKNWEDLIDIKPKSDMSYVTFVDSTNGWALGSLLNSTSPYWSKIYNSNDGGLTWKKQFDDSLYNINKIVFIDSNNGFAVGSKLDFNGSRISSAAFKTSNGGSKWILQNDDLINIQYSELTNVFYLDKSNVWITGHTYYLLANNSVAPLPFICKSSDGGNTWKRDTIGISNYKHYIYGIYFKDLQNGWAFGGFQNQAATTSQLTGNIIYKTSNGGASWKICYMKDTAATGLVRSLIMVDSLNGFAVGRDYSSLFLYSSDAGNTWTKSYSFTGFNEFSNITFVDRLTGWINVIDNRDNTKFSSLHTENGGYEWGLHENTTSSNNLSFVDSKHGWSASSDGTISKYRSLGIKTLKPMNQSYCTGEDIQIPFSFDTKINHYIEFVAQISDSTGSFIKRPIIGSSYDYKSGVINAKLPKDLPVGNYKLRVWYSDNDVPITITKAPSPILSGSQTVCKEAITNYQTKLVTGNQYKWLITGGIIVGDSTSNEVQVKWNQIGIGNVEVTESRGGLACNGVSELKVKVYDNAVNTDLNIIGKTKICSNESTIQEYSNNELGVENKWSVSGGSIIGDSIGNKVQVNWISGQNDTIFLEQKFLAGGCIYKIFKEIIIDSNPINLTDIIGLRVVCPNTTHTYSIKKDSNTTYIWNVTGGKIQKANNLDSVIVKWGVAANAIINVTSFNKIGCTQNKTQQIYINGFGIKISGDFFACFNDTTKYYIPTAKGITKKWTINRGIILGDSTGDTVNIYWNTSTGIRSISLKLITPDGNCETNLGPITITNKKYNNLNLVSQTLNPIEWSNKLFNIPISINSSKCLGLGDSDYVTMKIKLRKTMFLPKINDNLSYQDVGMDRIISMKVGGNEFVKGDTIKLLTGYLLLGDSLEYEIKLVSNTYSNNIFPTDTLISGKLSYTGIPNDYAGLRLMKRKEISITSIFPNPATDKVNITIESSDDSEHSSLAIYDMIGNRLLSKDIQLVEGTNHQAIEFGNQLESGMYYIHLKGTENTETMNFVIGK